MTETDNGAAFQNKYRTLKAFFTTNPGNGGSDNDNDAVIDK